MEPQGAAGGPLQVRDLPGGVREMLMCEPQGRNALDETMRVELGQAFSAAYADHQVRAVVLASGGRNFSVGGDVGAISQLTPGQASHARMTAVGEIVRLLGSAPKPWVAAVNGHCTGAGAGLALLADTLFLGRSGSIGFPFLKIGLVADFGITHTLARRIGDAAARQVLLYARTLGADEALRLGLVDEVVADGDLRDRAREAACQLASMPAHALRQLRQLLRRPLGNLEASVEAEALHQALCFGSADMREGIDAFRNKRPARFAPSADDPDLSQ